MPNTLDIDLLLMFLVSLLSLCAFFHRILMILSLHKYDFLTSKFSQWEKFHDTFHSHCCCWMIKWSQLWYSHIAIFNDTFTEHIWVAPTSTCMWECNSMQSDASGKEVNGPAIMGIQKNSWYFEWEVCVGRQLWRGRDCQIISWVCKQAGDKFPQSPNTMLGRGWELCYS